MSRHVLGGDAVVASAAVDDREWLQAADIVLARHRTLRCARRWLGSARRHYPGATVVMSRHRRGRWCLVGLPHGISVLFAGPRRWRPAEAERIGRISYQTWLSDHLRPDGGDR